MFRLCDVTTQKFVELHELECLVAQSMDGQRTAADLTSFARSYNPAITQAQIELLLVQLLHLGLLEDERKDEPVKPGHGKVIPLPLPKPQGGDEFAAFRNELVLDIDPSEALKWSDATSPNPRAPLFEPARRSSRVIPVARDHQIGDFDNTVLTVGDEAFAVVDEDDDELDRDTNLAAADLFNSLDPQGSDVYTSAPERGRAAQTAPGVAPDAPAPAPPAPPPAFAPPYAPPAPAYGQPAPASGPAPAFAPPPQPEAPRPLVTPQQAEAEQEELFKQADLVGKKRWYQRTSVRFLIVLGVLVLVSSLVSYPLYVTSECAIIPSQRAYVRSPMGGVLAKILVDEGSVVKKGDVLARLDDRQLQSERRKALAEIERIEAELKRLKRGARPEEILQQRAIVGARASEVRYAKKEARRKARMLRDGVGSKQAADAAQADYQVKQNAYAEAVAALRLLKSGARPEEITAREAGLERARAELAYIDQQLEEMVVIRAPMDGVVLTPKFRERLHENLEPGGLVCEIADMRTVRAEIFVPEREIDSIEIGMPVVVKVESYPRHPFQGKVDFIAPAVEVRDDVNVVRVVAVLDNQDGLLRQDMTGYGEVECGDKSLFDLATRRFLRWIRVRFLI